VTHDPALARAQLRALAARARTRGQDEAARDASHRPAAVLVLFGVLDRERARAGDAAVARELDVLLVRRADTLRQHPGQVSFPGGRVDPGDDGVVGAALREAHEETGLDPAGVEVLGTLPDVALPVSDHLVTPVLAWWARPSPVRVVDHRESAAVFRAPVADLLDPAHRRTATLTVGGTVRRTPAFLAGDHLVWGFTALVLDRLFDELGWAVPWDAGRTLEIRRA
jgi:8-oxo-dGTP pyrophosphatase MutT (NUDIX family)